MFPEKTAILLSALLLTACARPQLSKTVSPDDLDRILQVFTERRFDYNLRAPHTPSNYDLLAAIAKENGIEPGYLLVALKEQQPEIFRALLGGQ